VIVVGLTLGFVFACERRGYESDAGEPPARGPKPTAPAEAAAWVADAQAEIDASLIDAAVAPGDLDLQTIIERLVDEIFVASYQAFEERALELRDSAHALCDGVQTEREAGVDAGQGRGLLSAAQLDWTRARAAWKQCDAFAFGPYRDQPDRIGPKLDTYPVRATNLTKYLVEERATAEALAEQGTGLRGLPVVELLLFENGEFDANLAAFSGTTGELRCGYLKAATDDVALLSSQMVAAWQGGYAEQVKTAGAGSATFERLHDALSEIVNRVIFTVENLRVMKVAKPAGIDTGEEPLPGLFESQYSDRANRDAHDAIVGIHHVYTGSLDEGSDAAAGAGTDAGLDTASRPAPGGIQAVLSWRSPDLDRAVRAALAGALAAIHRAASFADATANDPERMVEVAEALRQLHLVFAVDVAAAIGVTVTFNDTDGD
jgi:predicted lipoprotein